MTNQGQDHVAPHQSPVKKSEFIAFWRKERRINVPTRDGILQLHIVRLIEATYLDGESVDAVITARASIHAQDYTFAVVFSDVAPPPAQFSLPALWIDTNNPADIRWMKQRGKSL